MFAVQARWPDASVEITGESREWSRLGESGHRSIYRFCPRCGATLAYVNEEMPGVTAIAVGAFADPGFPPPRFSVWERRRHPWVAVTAGEVEHWE